MSSNLSVGEYLLRRLRFVGVEHVFGVPGDFALSLDRMIVDSGHLQWIGMCGELGAAYAADGYARVKGAAAVVTTYAVGELSAVNGVAGAFSEHVPVAVITGAPPRSAFDSQLPLHHTLGNYDVPRQIFEKVTVANAVLKDPSKAAAEIDRVLSSMILWKRPVYLSIPSDVVWQPTGEKELAPDFDIRSESYTDANTLKEAVDRAFGLLSSSTRPVILADVEVDRYSLQQRLERLIEKSGIPYATLMMGKCVMPEDHPQNIGLYMGSSSREYVQQRVEHADVVLQLGVVKTDLNSGGFSMDLERKRTISAGDGKVDIGYATYHAVSLGDFMDELANKFTNPRKPESDLKPARSHAFHRRSDPWVPAPKTAIRLNRFFDKMACIIPPNSIVVAETGNALFGAAETLMPPGVKFISQVFYGSIGYTLPAALGASIAAPNRPVVLFIGDGSFQVTGQELSSLIRHRANVAIFLVNNSGYTIERMLVEGPFNDIQEWNYPALVKSFGGHNNTSQVVRTEEELESAMQENSLSSGMAGVQLFEIDVSKGDCAQTMVKAADAMRQRIRDGVPKDVNLPTIRTQQ